MDICAGIALRQITALFSMAGFEPNHSEARPAQGERRSLVSAYYAAIDWANPQDCRRFLEVLSLCLSQAYIEEGTKQHLRKVCAENSLTVDGNHVRFSSTLSPDWLFTSENSTDRIEFSRYCERMVACIDTDPESAIGAAKELVEAVAKHVLLETGDDPTRYKNLLKLTKHASKSLRLAPDDISREEITKGESAARQVLGALGSVVQGLAELRNLFGTGHGTARRRSGVRPRHARLATGAAIALATFWLDTLDERTTD